MQQQQNRHFQTILELMLTRSNNPKSTLLSVLRPISYEIQKETDNLLKPLVITTLIKKLMILRAVNAPHKRYFQYF